ncbi:MAG: thiamine-phosphate kinase [bacterium]|nr:thiamine-phosphate kinase [bacterium]MDT8395207.1 thiamine-phosphate kinase [bacterium]
MKISDVGEFKLIEMIEARAGLPSYPVVVGIGDDAAVLDVGPRTQVVTTTDMLVEGVHFGRETTPPRDLGYKSLAVNLSDLAAMGASPVQSFLSMGLTPDTRLADLEAFVDGFLEAGKGITLAGGDTVSSPSGWVISVTVMGLSPSGKVLRRDMAKAGERLWLCGPVGDAAGGLSILLGETKAGTPEDSDFLVRRHNRPEPMVRMGKILLETGFSACAIDVSDGLLQDLGHICRKSRVGAEIETEKLPLGRQLLDLADANGKDPLDWALAGGEDYSLLFTVPPEKEEKLAALVQREELDAVSIGRIVPVTGIRVTRDGEPVEREGKQGWDHFSR